MRTILRPLALVAIMLSVVAGGAATDTEPLAPIPPASAAPPSRPAGALSDRIASYTIRAALDPQAKQVTGAERVTWRNPSDVPVGELQFHLYLNAFRDRNSTFMRESGGQLRGDALPEGKFGGIEVTAMRVAGGEDLLPALEFIHPDDDNEDDRTVARVPLSRPVAPGETLELDVEFVSTLPGVFARTGYKDEFFLVGQWFPKLGVFEPRGRRGRAEPGWNCHQFHAHSEFYADFGVYDVELTVPSEFVVGATGALVERRDAGGGATVHHYRQEDVHDFAWTADSDYVVGTRTYSEAGFPEVRITALVQPEHRDTVERHLDACERSLAWMNRTVGPYPYATLTVVDPERGGEGAGGMEYPTFITAGYEVIPTSAPLAEDDPLLEIVTLHEFAHQYWYAMVASNEFEEPWMDEGMTSYFERRGMTDVWPEKRALWIAFGGVNLMRMPFDNPELAPYTRYAALPHVVRSGPLINTSWNFGGNYGYGVNNYARPAVVLATLEGYLGRERMDAVWRAYFERWRFGHPTSQDFFDVASEVAGEDLAWFFDQYFRSKIVLDNAVLSVEARDGETVVTLERRGEGVLPVRAVVTRRDGSTETIEWDGRAEQQAFPLAGASPVVRVEIDPERRLPLDANVTNNSWVAETDVAGPARVASDYGLFFQHVLLLLAGAV